MKSIVAAALLLLSCSVAYSAPLGVTIWKPYPGKSAQMVEQAMAAKAIQEKLGATVTIAMENTGRMHYVMNYDNLDHLAKVQDTANEEFSAFMERQSANPTGDRSRSTRRTGCRSRKSHPAAAEKGPLSFGSSPAFDCAESFRRGTVDAKECESGSDG
jgi:hypothetical protein